MKCKCGNELLINYEKKPSVCIECQMNAAADYELKRMDIAKDKSVCDVCGNLETAPGCINEKCLICGKGIQKNINEI